MRPGGQGIAGFIAHITGWAVHQFDMIPVGNAFEECGCLSRPENAHAGTVCIGRLPDVDVVSDAIAGLDLIGSGW